MTLLRMRTEELADDETIYRFVSIFDLFELLENQKLRLTKLSKFADQNEGVGHILYFQDDPLFRQKFIEREAIRKEHAYICENHYASCWTTEPDQISMWSLYSPDYSSIRISTTAAKLRKALHDAHSKMQWQDHLHPPGSRKLVTWRTSVQKVEYIDFFQARDEVRQRWKNYEELQSKHMFESPNYLEPDGAFRKHFDQMLRERAIDREGIFLKDRAYVHENEVRGVLYCGVRNGVTAEALREKPNPFANFFDAADPGELPDYLQVDTSANLVESLCFDPRLPKYKREVFEKIINSFSGKIAESRAFGYALAQESFACDYDGNPQ